MALESQVRGKRKRYTGYRSFQYLEAGADYEEFKLAREVERVQGWIRDKCPDQLKLPYMLWTAPVVREVIRRRLGKELGESTVRLYLERWGFTPQKPMARATQRSDAAITRWLHQEYPLIARRAKLPTRSSVAERTSWASWMIQLPSPRTPPVGMV